MVEAPGLKLALKRGALIAAANWPLVVVQFIAESTLKLLLAVPIAGGVFLVVLALDAEVDTILSADIGSVVAAVLGALSQHTIALAAFLVSFLVVLLGASTLTFIVKSGTVSLLAQAEGTTGPIERAPIRLRTLQRAGRTAIEPFLEGCRRFGPRYVRLGACLLLLYGITAFAYSRVFLAGYESAEQVSPLLVAIWIGVMVVMTGALLVWILLVNVFYLLTQMVIAVEDLEVRPAVAQVWRFVRARVRELAGVFGVVLVLVLAAVAASFLAMGALGLLSWVPLLAITVMPLHIATWVLRGLVFQFLALTALGAYLTHYRFHRRGCRLTAIPGQRLA